MSKSRNKLFVQQEIRLPHTSDQLTICGNKALFKKTKFGMTGNFPLTSSFFSNQGVQQKAFFATYDYEREELYGLETLN